MMKENDENATFWSNVTDECCRCDECCDCKEWCDCGFVMFFSSAAADSSDSPNENLFKLLLENMERLNDREITLTEEDWRQFTRHVQSRRRNGVPLPFPEEICRVEDPGRSTVSDILGADKKARQKSALSMKWRCFIRAVAGLGCGRIILTFLPASLKHVQLMGKKGRSRSSSLGSGAKIPDQSAQKNIEEQKQGPFMTQDSLEGSLSVTLL